MKHTKRKYNKTQRKKRNNKKTTKIIFTNKKRKTRKQHGSGKYSPSDIYNIDQFVTNDCLNILKSNPNRSESGMLNKMFTSKKNDPYVKCRRSIGVLNTEKMPPDEYLKYREIIKVTKNDPYYSNPNDPNRDDVEKIGKKYIFDYIFKLHGDVISGNSKLRELLKVISPCYLIYILTYQNYTEYITRLQEISQMNRTKGKIISAAGPTAKTFANIDRIYYWVSETNFNLFKLKTPQDLTNLFNSYYPINCPYDQELNHFDRLNITATQVQETSSRYVNNSSWDLYLDISFDNFYSDYFSNRKYNFKEVYSDLFGESFERTLSTNIINSNGEVVSKTTDIYKDQSNLDKVARYFNNFILKLNELGGTNKFDSNAAFTVGEPDTNVNIFKYDDVNSNKFIENIVKFLAISMFPLISYVTKFKIRPNYYGLFYHYYEESDGGNNMSFEDNINFEYTNFNDTPITEIETEVVNRFINSNIPNNNYDKCVGDLRKYQPNDLFPFCRIIDTQNNMLFSFNYYTIRVPNVTTTPRCIVGRYFQIMKVDNILNDTDVKNNNVTVSGLILWGGNMNSIVEADVPNGFEISYMKDTLEKIVPMFVGDTFFNGFMQPIFSPLKQVTPVNSRNTTPRNTMSQIQL